MDLLDRLHQRLLEAAAETPAPAYTVGDVYQQLVPYRGIRRELGVWELSQYEHTLLRLLAGERGYVEVAEAGALEEIQRELRSPNPILGIYRDYADVGVRISGAPDPVAEPLPAPRPSRVALPTPPAPFPAAEPRPAAQPESLPESPAATAVDGLACRRCHAALPTLDGLRFCPECGADQEEADCGHCGTPLRAEWNFCIRCGRRRADRAAPA